MNEIQIFKKPDYKKLKAFEDNIKNPYMGIVYACEYGENVKIGSSGEPYSRLTTLIRNAEKYGGLSIGAFAITPLHTNFRDNEKLLHSFFANSRVEGTDLFSISLQQAIDKAKKLELRDDSVALGKRETVVTGMFKKIVTGEAFRGTELDVTVKPITQVTNKGNVRGYLDQNLNVWLNVEDVAKGFGFTQVKNGVIYIRWNTVNSYLRSFGFSQLVGKDSYIPENMVYRLGFKANNEVAQSFQKKLADEILPSIRKTGGYMISKMDDTPELIMARALQIANDTISRHEKELADAKNKIAMQHDRIGTLEGHLKYNMEEVKKLTPDAEYARKTLSSTTSWNTNIIAKEIGLSAVTLNKRLQGLGIQYKEHGVWVLTHKYQDKGYTKTSTYNYPKSDGTLGTRIQTEWTEKGRRFIHELSDAGRI